MINNPDSPHLIVDQFQALTTGCDLCLWGGGGGVFVLFYPADGLCDLQANDAEKLLLMWPEWRCQLWLDCCLYVCQHYLPEEAIMQEIDLKQFI